MEKKSHRKKKREGFRDRLGIFGPAILITILAFVVAYFFVEPAPPRKITIGTGEPSGAYFAFAQRYRELLDKEGVTLEIRNTAGSVENLKLLEAKEGGVDIAFVQGGIGNPTAQPELRSLGSLYFEPLWVFYHPGEKIKRLSDLRGKRIAVGPEESGVKAIATKLLTANPTGITKVRGTPQEHMLGGRHLYLLPLFHPAAGLRTPRVAEQLREDFRRIPDLLAQPLPESEPLVQREPEPDQMGLFG